MAAGLFVSSSESAASRRDLHEMLFDRGHSTSRIRPRSCQADARMRSLGAGWSELRLRDRQLSGIALKSLRETEMAHFDVSRQRVDNV
jgi:hypothetical protein